jgi:hypothetical protein
VNKLQTVTLRREELARRVDSLPAEIDTWSTRSTNELDMDVHFSQLAALKIFMTTLVERQKTLLGQLDPSSDGDGFRVTALALVQEIINGQRVWDYFRDKLELRFSPDFKEVLWVADTIAWDCYRPVMDRAVQAGILPAANVREPPLTYLTAEFSPATWVRGSRPNDGRDYHLGTANLPIPVIELPWDHMGNLWELVSLQHEVAHDLEADLRLKDALKLALRQALEAQNTPPERVTTWVAWEGEIFADLVGLQLGGSAFALGLMHLLLLPSAHVTTYDQGDPHPTHWVRILMNAAYVRTLAEEPALESDATAIKQAWRDIYGSAPNLEPYVADFEFVFRGLMDTKLDVLKGKTVRELVPYTAADDARIRQAATYLETGQDAPGPLSLAPRHALSAARLAVAAVVEKAVSAGSGARHAALAGELGEINTRLIQLVRDQAPSGLRAGDTSTPHQDFIAGLASKF